ncbi:unnamed protein product [Adineta steineri]|uniref:Uncharacterized protein n=1 Tax=Adineta steineri TaxID=433720 RepID=A0A815KN40_9BILA|nr:unnamed protein product [Adineta steineri]CAF1613395.1 unnamed protein product [Adineta steineri]
MSGYHFLYPSHHTHSTSNSSKRPRTSTASAKQTTTAPKKLFSYTLYDRKYFFQHYHHTSGIRLSNSNHDNETTYYTDITREYAGQAVLASAQITRFDVKILPNESTNECQPLIRHPPQSPPSVVQFRLPHIRQSILNTSNELAILSVTNLSIQSVCRQSFEYDQLYSDNVQVGTRVQRVQQEVNLSFIRLVYQFYTVVGNALEYTEIKPDQPSIISRKQQQHPTRHMAINVTNETLLLSSFGWLIIDEIYYAASLGGLKVDGCMGKVQGNVSLSQRLRAYDGPLIFKIGSTSLSLKKTLSTHTDNLPSTNISTIHPSSSNRGVTNIDTIARNVPLRPQEVHDLVNRAGRLITSYVQEFLPGDIQQISSIPATTNTDNDLINTSLNDIIEGSHTPIPSEQTTTKKKRSDAHCKDPIIHNINRCPLETQQNISISSKRPMFETHITTHCQGLTFFTTLLSTLKVQYKIGVTNIGGMKSRFTTIIYEHALHF